MSGLVAEEFVPSTFAERGIAVPFTTPLLSQARLRLDRNERFEFLLPNFTGGKGVYVMPWKSLPSVMTITLHDRLLFEEIEALSTQSPETIRKASLKVQASGVAGPDAAAAAEKLIAEDEHYVTLTQFILVTELLKLVGIGAQDLLKPGMTADQAIRLARQSLSKVAAQVKVSPEEMTARVDNLGSAVFPVGLPQAPQPGRLRSLLKRLEWFKASAAQWSEIDVSDASVLGRYVTEIAEHTLAIGRDRLTQLDKVCNSPKQAVTDEPRFRGAIVQHVDKLSWLFDGWDFLVAMWEAVQDRPGEPQQSAMVEISRLVPAIPKEELNWMAEGFDPEALAKIQRRWVRMNEDWRTGSLDMDAVMRIEQIKTALA